MIFALTFQNHTNCPLTDFGGKTSIFSHPVYLFLRKFSLQDFRGGSCSNFCQGVQTCRRAQELIGLLLWIVCNPPSKPRRLFVENSINMNSRCSLRTNQR
ncbi:hypothetical protein D9G42_25860 [Escherichia coli]|nr:hypothetical protein [Escherichia coli]